MIFITPGTEFILPLAISLLAVVWLSACTVFDVRTHQVPNGLTLPAIPVALLAAWLTKDNRGETLYESLFHLAILILPLFLAWRSHLLGGADLKILVVLSLIDPLLVIAAWIGVMIYFIGLLVLHRSRPVRFAGTPGFALGIGLFTIGQLGVLLIKPPAA
jgi:Flp pilus assembly protein protease CpaA